MLDVLERGAIGHCKVSVPALYPSVVLGQVSVLAWQSVKAVSKEAVVG